MLLLISKIRINLCGLSNFPNLAHIFFECIPSILDPRKDRVLPDQHVSSICLSRIGFRSSSPSSILDGEKYTFLTKQETAVSVCNLFPTIFNQYLLKLSFPKRILQKDDHTKSFHPRVCEYGLMILDGGISADASSQICDRTLKGQLNVEEAPRARRWASGERRR